MQLAKFRTGSAAALAAARGFSLLSFIAATALLSRALPQASYGTFRQCWTLYSVVAPILGIGVAQSLFFFGARSTDGRDWRLVRRSLLLTLVASAFAAAAIGIGSRQLAATFSNPTAAPAFAAFAIFTAGAIPLFLSDAIFMTAAVADYQPVRAFAVIERKQMDDGRESWIVQDVHAGKVGGATTG